MSLKTFLKRPKLKGPAWVYPNGVYIHFNEQYIHLTREEYEEQIQKQTGGKGT